MEYVLVDDKDSLGTIAVERGVDGCISEDCSVVVT